MITLPWQRRTLQQMLDDLANCGIHFRDGASIDLLFREQTGADRLVSRKALEKSGFESVLIAMGAENITTNYNIIDPASNDVWHFDTECIEDHGAYKTIVERLCRMTRGDFVCEHVRDYVDVAAEVAWVELAHGGQLERVTFKVNNDWVDERVFSFMQTKLTSAGSARRFAVHGLGQDMLIVCMALSEINQLNRATRLQFRPIT